MLFNSFEFLLFFILVYGAYLAFSKSKSLQNILLLAASYFFYGSWDYRFLGLIAVSTVVDYFVGRAIYKAPEDAKKRRSLLLALSVSANLGILGFFKYYNFFVESFSELMKLIGMQPHTTTLQIILPVGISFYTFQTMSYTIDIYRKQIKPTRNFIDFAVFVSFFPQLVAGPIERASHLIPQFEKPRRISATQIDTGIFLILWGLFKKMVVADNAGFIADQVFNNYTNYHGVDTVIGVLAFSAQIYGDFSGYSDIARGLSLLMGIELMVNFRLPYFALNPTDFWRRWHISLSTWLRDYLYIPLGGNRKGTGRTYCNLFLTMLLGGLWHGAAWNFVIWGAFHGAILILYRLIERKPAHLDPWGGQFAYPLVLAKMLLMFILTLLGWLIFRAASVEQIVEMLSGISLDTSAKSAQLCYELFFYVSPLIMIQLYQYITRDLLILTKFRTPMRSLIYGLLLTWIFVFGVRDSLEFIYFQF